MTFEQQKQWVQDNAHLFPHELKAGHIFYLDVHKAANSMITVIEARIRVCKERNSSIHKDAVAMSMKNNLAKLIRDIQHKDKLVIKEEKNKEK